MLDPSDPCPGEPPTDANEIPLDYALRLEGLGREEMEIRKALADHFGLGHRDIPELLDGLPEARLRHVALLRRIAPGRTRYAMIRKVALNLGLAHEDAARWVDRYKGERAGGASNKGKADI